MRVEPAIREQLVAVLPNLRAFAFSLCGNWDRADDLVQDTLLRAWSHLEQFQPGTNLSAWLFTILRHRFITEHRKRRREVEDVEGRYSSRLCAPPEQDAHLDLEDFRRALMRLTHGQREALFLVAVQGLSYEDAASICGCVVGTVKSRVSRARTRLAELLSLDHRTEIGPDRVTRAALQFAA